MYRCWGDGWTWGATNCLCYKSLESLKGDIVMMIGSQGESMLEDADVALQIAEEAYGSAEMIALDDAELDGVSSSSPTFELS